jgi:hypothetical protein
LGIQNLIKEYFKASISIGAAIIYKGFGWCLSCNGFDGHDKGGGANSQDLVKLAQLVVFDLYEEGRLARYS